MKRWPQIQTKEVIIISLNDFIQGWQTGDYISIQPQILNDYFICHAMVYLSPDVENYAYPMDLIGTPIPYENYAVSTAGSMYVVNHNQQQSYFKEYLDDNEKVPCKGYDGVQIFASPCFSDDGSTSPPVGVEVSIVWQLSSKYHFAQQWIKNAYRYWDYAIYPGEYESGNPPNLMVEWTADELDKGIRRVDIRMHIWCSWISGNWTKETIIENIQFDFT
ncbi:MAG: hypothetical protein QXQ02_08055 [Halobacteria archaeon]